MSLIYNKASKQSILEFAKRLEGSTVGETLEKFQMYQGMYVNDGDWQERETKEYSGKGNFGQFLEEAYFGKQNDSKSEADFEEAGLELKTAPLKRLKNGKLTIKERVVLGIINFNSIVDETFEDSHFLNKNLHILLVFFIYNTLVDLEDIQITLVDIWNCIEEDGEQIKNDWETIVGKIKAGKAHEISEGDTLFLGASTKGSKTITSQVSQPFSPILAHRRAFGFKLQYVRYIYKTLLEKKAKSRPIQGDIIRLTKGRREGIEQIIEEAFQPYLGMGVLMVCDMLDIPYNPQAKHFYAQVGRAILGVRTNQHLYEFEAAGIKIKTVRIEPNGRNQESVSFRYIRYTEIVDQEWEDSDLYYDLTTKFLFITFKRNNPDEEYYIDDFLFWNMPTSDLEVAKMVWLDTKEKIEAGNYKNFIGIKDKRIAHIRPHGKNAADKTPTPQGTMESKKSFWLNRNYILNVINEAKAKKTSGES